MARGILLLAAVALAGCSFSSAQEATVGAAIESQNQAIADRQFAEILRELDAQESIDWDGRLNQRAAAEAAAYPRAIDWLLARFASEGGLSRSRLLAWRKWNPLSKTTAATTPHTATRLNLWRLTADPVALANTLTHERVHFFGVVHPGSQTRLANKCDPAYVAGDLAEALLASRPQATRREKTEHICPALCSAIARRGLWSPCTGSQ